MYTYNKLRQVDAKKRRVYLGRYVTSTDIYTNNWVRCKVLKFIFTSLGINNDDKPTASENLLDYIDAR